MTFKPSHAWRIAAACALLCTQAAHAADPDFTFKFNGTATGTNQAAQGSVYMYPSPSTNTPLVDETLADGTRHRAFKLDNITFSGPWQVNSGALSIQSLFDGDHYWATFNVDQYLYTDGSTRLNWGNKVALTPGRHNTYETSLAFTLDCACGSLFTSEINADTFARYDALSGVGAYKEYFYDDDVGHDVLTVDKRIAFTATAVPEPGVATLMLAGMGWLGLRRKLRAQGGAPSA